MFGIARMLVQHKMLWVAAGLAGYFLFSSDKEEAPVPSSPWAVNAPAPTTTIGPKEKTLTQKALAVANDAAEYAGVEEYMPTALQEQAVEGLNKSESALSEINKAQ